MSINGNKLIDLYKEAYDPLQKGKGKKRNVISHSIVYLWYISHLYFFKSTIRSVRPTCLQI
jgi:hypothetical protein